MLLFDQRVCITFLRSFLTEKRVPLFALSCVHANAFPHWVELKSRFQNLSLRALTSGDSGERIEKRAYFSTFVQYSLISTSSISDIMLHRYSMFFIKNGITLIPLSSSSCMRSLWKIAARISFVFTFQDIIFEKFKAKTSLTLSFMPYTWSQRLWKLWSWFMSKNTFASAFWNLSKSISPSSQCHMVSWITVGSIRIQESPVAVSKSKKVCWNL